VPAPRWTEVRPKQRVVSSETTLFCCRRRVVQNLGPTSLLITIDPGITDDAVRNQAIPDEKDRNCAEGCRDEAGALIGPVPADGLTDPGRKKCPGDAEGGGENEAGRLVRPGRNHPGDDPSDEADQDNPKQSGHGCP